MDFNLREFIVFTRRALTGDGVHYRLTPKRLAMLGGFYALFSLVQFGRWAGSAFDEILYGTHRDIEIKEPVFIVGNPRSGTTFLHRLLAKDKSSFTTTALWEIFAPSITQRRVVHSLSRLDQTLGGPVHRIIEEFEGWWHRNNVAHHVSFTAPEEDQYFMVHIWSSLAIWNFSAILEEAEPYVHFDELMPPEDQQRIMTFYKHCIQQHIYEHWAQHGAGPIHYLSKNPSASPKIDTLYRFFPDAKIIYLVRNPLDMIPSFISILNYTWEVLGDPVDTYEGQKFALEMARHWYRYPLERLERAPSDNYQIVNYNDLTRAPDRTVGNIYDHFGIDMSSDYTQTLKAETIKARNYKSRHRYSLAEMNLSREVIVAEYRDIFDRFGFDTREPTKAGAA